MMTVIATVVVLFVCRVSGSVLAMVVEATNAGVPASSFFHRVFRPLPIRPCVEATSAFPRPIA